MALELGDVLIDRKEEGIAKMDLLLADNGRIRAAHTHLVLRELQATLPVLMPHWVHSTPCGKLC